MSDLLKLTVYVPASHLDAVKDALFAAGAGLDALQAHSLAGAMPLAGMYQLFLNAFGREEPMRSSILLALLSPTSSAAY